MRTCGVNTSIKPRLQWRLMADNALQERGICTKETPTVGAMNYYVSLVREIVDGDVGPPARIMVIDRRRRVSGATLKISYYAFAG